MIYEPREDSYLIKKHISKYSEGTVLDMGTGSGILAKEASKNAEKVYAVDINPKAVDLSKKNHKKIQFLQSDLFYCFKDKDIKFNLIIFNPPYLPDHKKVKDIALDGGKHGYEVIERFLNSANNFMRPDGKILLLFSSYSKKGKVDEFIRNNCFKFSVIDTLKLDFEELYVYLIEKSVLLRDLENKGIVDVYFLTKGRRGIIFTGNWKRKKITIKAKLQASQAIGRIQNEIRILKLLKKKNIGPKLLSSGDDYFIYEFVNGEMIVDYIKNNNKNKIINTIKDVFHQLYILDKMQINKEEMHHPVKHILVDKKPVLIDFERARFTEKPQNVTQFCQFLIEMTDILKQKNIIIKKDEIIELARRYKKNKDLRPILRILK